MLKADIARYDIQMLRWRIGIENGVIIDMNVAISLDANTSVSALLSDDISFRFIMPRHHNFLHTTKGLKGMMAFFLLFFTLWVAGKLS